MMKVPNKKNHLLKMLNVWTTTMFVVKKSNSLIITSKFELYSTHGKFDEIDMISLSS
jgi:hypothetical protein